MEDDEEVQSPPSSPTPRPNGRITVAVAATPQPVSTLTLALPIQQPKSGGGREDCWSEAATAVLIEAWGSRHLDLSRGNLKQEHWKEVADVVNGRQTPDSPKIPRTHVQCKNRIDTVKKKFKLENSKIGPSKWPFYKRLHQLIGPATTTKIASSMSSRRQKVPMGIPVGTRSAVQYRRPQKPSNKPFRRRKMPAATDSDSSQSEPDSTDSFPPERKRPKFHKEVKPKPKPKPTSKSKSKSRLKSGREKWGGGGSVREVTWAILRFGEAYEHAEISKLEQAVEMEKQRMKFTKELELQRMQFFMKTQLELSQLNHDHDEERWGEEPSSP